MPNNFSPRNQTESPNTILRDDESIRLSSDGNDAHLKMPNLWTLKTPSRYPGRIRNEANIPLNGFAVKDLKQTRKVSILFNGSYIRHYRYPKKVIAPIHPMVRWFNLPMCGMTLLDEDSNSLTDNHAIRMAVLEGKKPVGDIFFFTEDDSTRGELVKQGHLHGFEVIEYTLPHNANYGSFVMLGVNTPLAKLFDLSAICRFYHEGTGIPKSFFSEYFDQLAHLTPAQSLKTFDWVNPEGARELMLTGLCLGYAFESTLAIILEQYVNQ